MATVQQRAKLMAVTCPWCRAAPGEECTVASGRQGKPRPLIHTLDGGCHDARWQVALGEAAPVVLEREPPPPPVREPVTVGAAVEQRPW